MATILFDHPTTRTNLLPFTFTRPLAEIRVGIFTIAEKWKRYLDSEISYLTIPYLQNKFPQKADAENLYINGAVCPDHSLKNKIETLKQEECLLQNDTLIAFRTTKTLSFEEFASFKPAQKPSIFNSNITCIDRPWKIFQENASQIQSDLVFFQHLKGNKIEDQHTVVYNPENIYIEKGAKVKAAILNAENGPIYLGKDSEVKEGAMIRGSFALCEHSVVNMGAKIVGDSTIGPYSKVGGEMSNSVIFGYSNKAHDGFLGNSVIGEWCNLGADTNTSNLKNNYQKVKLWDFENRRFVDTGQQFCGLMFGDHSKCGINTMFNTGTVVGVGANVFGEGFPRNFIPSYAWGGARGFSTFQMNKFFEMAETVMQRRNMNLTEADKAILEEVFNQSAKFRTWENK